jgi:hypothetical protein
MPDRHQSDGIKLETPALSGPKTASPRRMSALLNCSDARPSRTLLFSYKKATIYIIRARSYESVRLVDSIKPSNDRSKLGPTTATCR